MHYFVQFDPGTEARARHLRDGGLGETARTNKFLADVEAGTLPPVTFYKPQGNLNMHAGYSDVDAGDRHIAGVIDALQKSPQWEKMLVVRSVEHTSELQSLMRISYAGFCLKKKKNKTQT